MAVSADDLETAVASVVDTLRPGTDRDWRVPADGLDWDCWHTGEHLGDCLLSYAMQLGSRPADRYVRFLATVAPEATPAQLLEFVEGSGRVLAAMVRTAPAAVRAWHPYGMGDPAGFAGMGCVEALLHGDDIARALGLTLAPPAEVCARVLARMFPQVAAELAEVDPWSALRWATGRTELPGRPRVRRWHWQAAPPDERG
ncbi:maleylpyruvate isomerase N-terminal domain-containing protein [Plantactinospora sp. KLBMP9567]|uniref:maleylpyruvate isomerase N-terminal domain-containing protein n=1 Tax=Plantactinospora sp. KLBMP9567 TaxID=3085900 RepID=UPI00298151A7|nr:maleylpyruvate isomerase N-terminal domain-containing protein [Plantactinospora sp. KLBMP9567]MDW5325715.1 maleylpyruvate isomerase N-terminal domain-containing protein [Plantactinospora sp. KLBMP9567]